MHQFYIKQDNNDVYNHLICRLSLLKNCPILQIRIMKVHFEVRPRLKVVNVVVEPVLAGDDDKLCIAADDCLVQINEFKFYLKAIR